MIVNILMIKSIFKMVEAKPHVFFVLGGPGSGKGT